MMIDILTKILPRNKHISCMDALSMTAYPSTPKQTFSLIKTFMVWVLEAKQQSTMQHSKCLQIHSKVRTFYTILEEC
jgi:hypothetical protein